ncbi:MAG: sigma-54 dependent transcriptional regulator [Holophagaceae bacterium]|nr:sigma-54 dependent transcriptional regulator [Holophagaceae bacterium]
MAKPQRILIVDDDPGMREGMALSLKRAGFVCEQARSGEDALQMTRPGAFDAVVTDLRMTGIDGLQLTARLKGLDPTLPVLLVTAFGSLDTAREAMRLGAFDFLSKPFSPGELVTAVKKSIRADNKLHAEEAEEAPVILTQDTALAETLILARRAADSRATILIQAESGTGKELFAKLIHTASPRRKGPFVAINCAAIPENLLESELFGYERGAFTGATTSKTGRFEQAEGGTIVLDEIGELPLALQGKLLRAIQERVIDRLGGSKPINIDVRIIALTNRDLAQEVKEGRFREDLFYRLNVIPLRLPPLRERKGDLHLLAAHFAERYSHENGRPAPALSPSFFSALELHPWPGNIRELENTIQRCVVLNNGTALVAGDLDWLLGAETINAIPKDSISTTDVAKTAVPAVDRLAERFSGSQKGSEGDIQYQEATSPAFDSIRYAPQVIDHTKPLLDAMLGTPVTLPLGLALPDVERFWLLSTLSAVGGNRTHCAQQLNIALRTVRNKINEYKEQGYTIPDSRRSKGKE